MRNQDGIKVVYKPPEKKETGYLPLVGFIMLKSVWLDWIKDTSF
jgi:hypothetical protein